MSAVQQTKWYIIDTGMLRIKAFYFFTLGGRFPFTLVKFKYSQTCKPLKGCQKNLKMCPL